MIQENSIDLGELQVGDIKPNNVETACTKHVKALRLLI